MQCFYFNVFKFIILAITFHLLLIPCFAGNLTSYYHESSVPGESPDNLISAPKSHLQGVVNRLTDNIPESLLKR